MKKPGFALKVAAVMNAILLAVGFIGCQSGAFNRLSDRSEPVESAPKAAVTAPSQESARANTQGLVTGPTPAGAVQQVPTDNRSLPSEAAKPAPTFMPSTKAVILPNFGPPQSPTPSKPSQDPPLNQRPQP